MAIPELGAKQVCPNCQTKFYDLTRRPAVCPACSFSFDPEEVVRTRRVRTRGAQPDYEQDEVKVKARDPDAEDREDEEELEEAQPELDAAAEADPLETDDADDAASPGEPDVGIGMASEEADLEEDEEADDVPFLEEEEDDEAFGDADIDLPPEGREEH